MKKQQIALRGKPRGRPFPPGKSGNPLGRPPGARNKFTLMVKAGVKRAELALSKLDLGKPYNSWGGFFEQSGRKFRKDSMTLIAPHAPIVPQPDIMNNRRPFQELLWQGRDLLLQDGWPFCRLTRKAVKI